MYLKHLSSLQFITYTAFFTVVIAALFKFVPGTTPPVRQQPYPEEELGAHDRKLLGQLVGSYAGEDYYGWRTRIRPDGSWIFFIAGD